VWEMFRKRTAELRGATLPLACRPVELPSLMGFIASYPDPTKHLWLPSVPGRVPES